MTIANHDGDRTAVFAIELRAVSPQGQHRRAYEIHVGPDLFGQLVVAIDFGVIGTRGQRLLIFPALALGDVGAPLPRHSLAETASTACGMIGSTIFDGRFRSWKIVWSATRISASCPKG